MTAAKTLLSPVFEWADYESLKRIMKPGSGAVRISGCARSQKTHLAAALGDDRRYVVIVSLREEDGRIMCRELEALGRSALLLPAIDYLFFNVDTSSRDILHSRTEVFAAMLEGKEDGPLFIVTTIAALMGPVPVPGVFTGRKITLRAGDETDLTELTDRLNEAGYRRVPMVSSFGEYAVRGGILDIWPVTGELPYRVEWWGDEIDTMRTFEPESQRSIGQESEAVLYPILENPEKEKADLTDYLDPDQDLIILDEPVRLKEDSERILKEYLEAVRARSLGREESEADETAPVLPDDLMIGFGEIAAGCVRFPLAALSALERTAAGLKSAGAFSLESHTIPGYNKSFEMLTKDLRRLRKNGARAVLLSPSEARAKRLAADLREYDLSAYYDPADDREVKPGEILVTTGYVQSGYVYPLLGWQVIAESDIFGERRKKKRPKRKGPALDFSELKPGDYVVHDNHGLGIYRGVEKIETEGIVRDYIKIAYADKANLYVPAGNLDVIRRYTGGDGRRPKLNKLGSNEWAVTKSRVKKAVEEIAEDLVSLYAERRQINGYAFSPDSPWQSEFEDFFPYEETDDQLTAIREVKKDMESSGIMDRLICGDVGYGKTEVALRAAFKAVQDSKQVAVLVPTTVLAGQHYNTFCQRFSHFPVRIAQLSRFVPPAEQKKTIKGLASGQVDIVIGTHRLLSKDIVFKDLGLLVVDEEQRFGVQAKKKKKKWRTQVDVITLTATPIPRTLHMSLIGIRDMSVLTEAPEGRSPVQTYVMEYDQELIREAMDRELARGGQVYYVHNRARDLADLAGSIRLMLPGARVAFAHGKMTENRLEQIMSDFVEGEIDVLVTTTIIETGLDIPNVNTLIVREADRFGLSQLYQLRGRVGRSGRTAYAFLTYRKDKELGEEADKRLAAIRQFTELGSGIQIAMRDLQIRGAGNMLGEAQSGHMAAVGYDLYCQMLSSAVRKLKSGGEEETFATVIDLDIDAFIPPSYIPDESQKLDVYRRVALLADEEEKEDLIDELIDRYGDIPREMEPLLDAASLRILAHEADVVSVEQKGSELKFTMHGKARTNPQRIPDLLKKYRGDLTFKMENPPCFVYYRKKKSLTDREVTVVQRVAMILGDLRKLIPEQEQEGEGK